MTEIHTRLIYDDCNQMQIKLPYIKNNFILQGIGISDIKLEEADDDITFTIFFVECDPLIIKIDKNKEEDHASFKFGYSSTDPNQYDLINLFCTDIINNIHVDSEENNHCKISLGMTPPNLVKERHLIISCWWGDFDD